MILYKTITTNFAEYLHLSMVELLSFLHDLSNFLNNFNNNMGKLVMNCNIYNFYCMVLLSPLTGTSSSVTTMIPVEEVVVAEDAVLVWYIKPDPGKQVKTVVLHKESINGPVLWYNQMKNDPDMPEVDESMHKLKKLFGDRASVSWTPVVNWISLRINNVNYNDSMTFVLRVSFKKNEDVLAHEFDSQEIRLEVKGNLLFQAISIQNHLVKC